MNRIFYFTGTGNSLKIAKDIALKLGDTDLVRISSKNNSYDASGCERVGIIFPVYCSGIPVIMKNFVSKLKIDKNAYIFAVSDFAGEMGGSINMLNTLLDKFNIKLSSDFGIKMPNNCITFFDVDDNEKLEKKLSDETKKIELICNVIKEKKNHSENNSQSSFTKFYQKFQYIVFHPYNWDKNFWVDTNKCIGCSICSKVCPVQNIAMEDKKPSWQHKCEQCMACINLCPKSAIQYKKRTLKRGRYFNPSLKVNDFTLK